MSPPDGSTTLTLNDSKAEEDRMRAALGLTLEPHTHRPFERHPQKLAAGSMVPVAVVSTRLPVEASDSSRARLATLTEELKTERSERVAAQQALADARQSIQQLQARLAHTEIAAAEALEAEQRARLSAEARLLELPRATVSKPKPTLLAEPRKRGRPPKIREVVPDLAAPKRRGRPPKNLSVAGAPEQEPVQWWLPSYAALKAKRPRSKG